MHMGKIIIMQEMLLPDSRSEPNTQALLTQGHSVSLQSAHLRGLTMEKEMNKGMSGCSCFSDGYRLLMLKNAKDFHHILLLL